MGTRGEYQQAPPARRRTQSSPAVTLACAGDLTWATKAKQILHYRHIDVGTNFIQTNYITVNAAQGRHIICCIDDKSRCGESMVEAAALMSSGATISLIIKDIAKGTMIGAHEIKGAELKDYNRARAYLREMADSCSTIVFNSLEEAILAL